MVPPLPPNCIFLWHICSGLGEAGFIPETVLDAGSGLVMTEDSLTFSSVQLHNTFSIGPFVFLSAQPPEGFIPPIHQILEYAFPCPSFHNVLTRDLPFLWALSNTCLPSL